MKGPELGLAVGLVAALGAGAANASFIIDDFNTLTTYTATNTGAVASSATIAAPISSGNVVLGLDGGPTDAVRSIEADFGSGPFNGSLVTEISSDLQMGRSAASSSVIGVSYFDYLVTNPLDLSAYNSLEFDYAADLSGALVTFALWDSATGFSTSTTGALAATGMGAVSFLFDARGVDLTGVRRINISVTGGNVSDLDFRIDNVRLTSVPEPTTLALFALGLAGLGAVRRKKLTA